MATLTTSELKHARKKITVTYGEHQVDVWYRPGVLTPKLYESLIADPESTDTMTTMLSLLLDDWELSGEDGQRLKPTKENLSDLPMPFLGAVSAAINEDVTPGKPNDSGSFGG